MQFDPSAISRKTTDRSNERIFHPFREACSLILYTFAIAIFSVVIRMIFRKLLGRDDILYGEGFSGFILAVAGTVIIVSAIAFAYAYLGSFVGRRRARTMVKGTIVAITFIGLSIAAGIALFGH